jgi:UDP-N-acetylmuramyl pentapeptide phosphotransferase/UDP-N-acetylglucosamine-1-phosphate transferase
MSILLYTPLLAFVVAYGLIWWLINHANAQIPVDTPNDRSLHSTPIPRAGGIGILTGLGVAGAFLAPDVPLTLWLGVIILFAVSIVDDYNPLPTGLRLAVHLSAACIFTFPLLAENHGIVTAAAIALAVGWMSNVYNFMDGSDGLAGGMTLFGFSFFAAAAWIAGSMDFALINASVAAAAAAFLFFNFHPARIFMGDAGSVPLGFLAATFGIIGWNQHQWAWWFPVMVFSPFIIDASVTLVRRLASGARVWEAHRDHYYQRLVRIGVGHRATALAEYAVMLTCGIAALWALKISALERQVIFWCLALLYVALIFIIENLWRAKGKSDA